MNIVKIDAGPENGRIEFATDAKIDPLTLVKMIQSQPQKYKLEGAEKLRFSLNMEKTDARFRAIDSLLSDLAVKTSWLNCAAP